MRRHLLRAALVASVLIAPGLARAHADADLAACSREEDGATAEPACTRALAQAGLAPAKRLGIHLYRGSARSRLGDHAGALADFDAAAAIAPSDPTVLGLRARALAALGR